MELLDIYDKYGNYIGTEDRKVVHEKGLYHKTVHCWLYDKEGNVYFQIRHDRKTFYTTASGHLSAGETVHEGFKREIKEEIGLDIDSSDAILVGVVPFSMDRVKDDGSIFKDRAFANVYIDEFEGDYEDLVFDPEEVDGLVKVNASDTLRMFEQNKGSVLGTIITADSVTEKTCELNEFLINDGETYLSKYGDVLKKIISVTKGK